MPRFRELRGDMGAHFETVDKRFDKLEAKFDAKIDRLTWGLLAFAAAIIATPIGNSVF